MGNFWLAVEETGYHLGVAGRALRQARNWHRPTQFEVLSASLLNREQTRFISERHDAPWSVSGAGPPDGLGSRCEIVLIEAGADNRGVLSAGFVARFGIEHDPGDSSERNELGGH
jgi:hypothetical protein